MTPETLLQLFRADMRDEAAPYLWSDVELYAYMDEAQNEFCRRTGGLADSSSAVCSIAVTAGAPYAEYDPRILKLRDLRRQSDGRNVQIINFEDLGTQGMMSDDYGRFNLWTAGGVKFSDLSGEIKAVVVGMDANKLRIVSTPLEDDVLLAIVYRLPLNSITPSSTAFEIDPQHHRYLMYWMKHLAYTKPDAETYDRGRAVEMRDLFAAYCDNAKAERERREHKYRSVAYGGL